MQPTSRFLKQFTLLILCLLVGTISMQAQQPNYDLIVTPDDARPRNFQEYLVRLAWLNTPENRVVEIKKEAAELGEKQAKWSWVENISMSLIIGQGDTLTVPSTTPNGTPDVFTRPGINYGFGINLGGIITSQWDRKIAATEVQIAGEEVKQQKLFIRMEVLSRYRKYLMTQEILKARTQASEDATTTYTILQELFRQGKTDVEEYNSAAISYFNAIEQRERATTEVEIAKLMLEEIIGIGWEVAERYRTQYGE